MTLHPANAQGHAHPATDSNSAVSTSVRDHGHESLALSNPWSPFAVRSKRSSCRKLGRPPSNHPYPVELDLEDTYLSDEETESQAELDNAMLAGVGAQFEDVSGDMTGPRRQGMHMSAGSAKVSRSQYHGQGLSNGNMMARDVNSPSSVQQNARQHLARMVADYQSTRNSAAWPQIDMQHVLVDSKPLSHSQRAEPHKYRAWQTKVEGSGAK